ncbi:hypothetical protein V8E54_000276 [Elaphomyces granulatus]|jgi:lupus La protein
MSDETKDTNATSNANAEAEKDVQSVLAELKAEEAKDAEKDTPAPNNSHSEETNDHASVEQALEEGQGIKEAAEITVKSENNEECKTDSKDPPTTNNSSSEEKSIPHPNDHAPVEQTSEEGRGVEEAAEVAKVAEKSENNAEKKSSSKSETRGSRHSREHKNNRDNIKSDANSQEESSDPDAIRKQVEFYFSDSNLPMDKFLLSKVGGSANRSVEISMLHSFQRMRRFKPFSAIVDALKTSETLELTDNDTMVRRKVPLPESVNDNPDPTVIKAFEDKAMNSSIYAKGFGSEKPSTQFDIEAFFAPYGPTNAIRLRRTYDKTFKGSVFVEFDSEETQKKFLALDPKPKWKGEELLIKSKKEYCDEKIREIEAGNIKPNRGRGGFRGRGRVDSNGDRDWRERRAEDQKKGFGKGRHSGRGHRGVQKDARGVPVVQSTVGNEEPSSSSSKHKRFREDDETSPSGEAGSAHPAKKVDVKEG